MFQTSAQAAFNSLFNNNKIQALEEKDIQEKHNQIKTFEGGIVIAKYSNSGNGLGFIYKTKGEIRERNKWVEFCPSTHKDNLFRRFFVFKASYIEQETWHSFYECFQTLEEAKEFLDKWAIDN